MKNMMHLVLRVLFALSLPTLAAAQQSDLATATLPAPEAAPALVAAIPVPPSTAAPQPADSNEGYMLGPEDVIEVNVLGQPEFRTQSRVESDGSIALPFIGKQQVAGQTPLGLAAGLKANGVTILGTSPDSINLAEERGAFGNILAEQELRAPEFGMAASQLEATSIAQSIGYPVLVRPSFVLGGRGMEIVYDDVALGGFITRATDITPDHPVLVDRFLDNAIEIDVDALFDGHQLFLGGLMEHIEEAGIHSGDSSCVVPPFICPERHLATIRDYTRRIARALKALPLGASFSRSTLRDAWGA